MRISQVKLDHFRRFTDLTITDIPETARLVVLAGPNGCGKTSLFDAFNLWRQINIYQGWENKTDYYIKNNATGKSLQNLINIHIHDGHNGLHKGSFYFRTAYRNDPEFRLGGINRLGPVVDDIRFRQMIQSDATVSHNYQRLVSQALESAFQHESGTTTIGRFREKIIGDIQSSTKRLFPDLTLDSLGNPLEQGTFRFTKGSSRQFDYMNLSGGEKAAFDLILDLVVKRSSHDDAIYCIDEPEAHMNTRLQGALLAELFNLLPQASQMWIATHSIGMMRRARELAEQTPGAVIFLDFGGHNFDEKVTITPSRPTRAFWEKVLNVALDDLATLVSPSEVVICEGNPKGTPASKNAEHDAAIYNTIFGDELPDVKFIAGGNSKDIVNDRLGFLSSFPQVIPGIKMRRLIDGDDHAQCDIDSFLKDGIITLKRRHLEAYVYDDEVLAALCHSVGRPGDIEAVLADKKAALASSIERNNPPDDIKSAAGDIYVRTKNRLSLTKPGNDQMAFARATLAPLIKPGMAVYGELKANIFEL